MNLPEIAAVLLIILAIVIIGVYIRDAFRGEAGRDAEMPLAPAPEQIAADNDINWEQLEKWYFKKARKHKSGYQFRTGLCIFLLVISVIFTIPALRGLSDTIPDYNSYGGYYGDYYGRDYSAWFKQREEQEKAIEKAKSAAEYIKVDLVVQLLANLFALGMFIHELSRKKYERLEDIPNQKLERTQLVSLWNIVDEIMQKADLADYDVEIYYLKINTPEAHVNRADKLVTLYLSRGLIASVSDKKGYLESVIGHEIGHVRQKDTRLTIINSTSFIAPVMVIILFAVIGVFLFGINDARAGGTAVMMISSFVFFIQKRTDAEYLADIGSIVFTRNFTIAKVIEELVAQKTKTGYPSKAARIVNINNVLKKFGSKVAFPTGLPGEQIETANPKIA
jgi:Zn-dependent protease with chaperone function